MTGFNEAEGYAASLRQIAQWVDEANENPGHHHIIGMEDIDAEELRAAAAFIERRSSDRTAAWQPIETAPKDGTPVDLFSTSGKRWCNYRWDADFPYGAWSGVPFANRNWRGRPFMYANQVTHWMPVPAGPPVSSTHSNTVAEPSRCKNPVARGESKEADASTGDAPVASASTLSVTSTDGNRGGK